MRCIPIPGGYICGVKVTKCSACKAADAKFACDFPVQRRGLAPSSTCDAPLCNRCRQKQPATASVETGLPGKALDFCPPHDRLTKARAKVTP